MRNKPQNFIQIAKSLGLSLVVLIVLLGTVNVRLDMAAARPADSVPDFNSQIAPILQKNCLACHSSNARLGDLVMESYAALIKGGKDGAVIVPGKADQSRMVLMLEGKTQPRMPFNTDPLPAADLATIKAWINAGAVGPKPGEGAGLVSAPAIPDIKPQVPVISPIASVKFSPDGKTLAVGGYREVRLLAPGTGKMLATLSGHVDYVRSIAFSSDGKLLAAGGGLPQREGEIKIWDLETRQPVKTLRGHKDCIY